jgi:hypothetical protein
VMWGRENVRESSDRNRKGERWRVRWGKRGWRKRTKKDVETRSKNVEKDGGKGKEKV